MPDPVLASLERLAEEDGDISREIYDDFAAHHPRWAALMSHMDTHMLGRMMQDLLVLLMTPPEQIDHNYLGFEISSHRAYGVTNEMFPPMLESARDIVRRHLDGEWSEHMERAWNERIAALEATITALGDQVDADRVTLSGSAASADG